MTIKRHLLVRNVVALLAATPLLWVAPPAFAQSAPTQDSRPAQDSDITRQELARFDQFLDSHREIAEQLRKNPSLVNDRTFVEQHQALQTYLREHPAIREELKENPNAFMRQEDRFDNRQDAQGRGDNDRNGDRDVARNEDRDRFDNRIGDRDIDRDDNRDPDARSGNRDDRISHQPVRDRDTTRGELASFDQFLDKHREIAEELRRDPGLVNNQQFLADHPALQTYLAAHKNVREEIDENPQAFMHQEARFDRQEDMDRERAGFGEFLRSHSAISEQLSKNPSLVKNQEFMATHPELQEYLKAHPAAQTQLTQNPEIFIKSAQQLNATTKSSISTNTTGSVKTTPPDATKPPKQ
jgi:dsDNA-binding SOS-regulon protein